MPLRCWLSGASFGLLARGSLSSHTCEGVIQRRSQTFAISFEPPRSQIHRVFASQSADSIRQSRSTREYRASDQNGDHFLTLVEGCLYLYGHEVVDVSQPCGKEIRPSRANHHKQNLALRDLALKNLDEVVARLDVPLHIHEKGTSAKFLFKMHI